jgi:hypothetical protein
MKLFAAFVALAIAFIGSDVGVGAASSRAATAIPRACGFERVLVRSGHRTRCISVWQYLRRRAVRVPTLPPGTRCPATSSSGDLSMLAPGIGTGTAFGPGPVYPVLAHATERAEIFFRYPPPRDSIDYGSRWSGQKVMWVLARPFRGPALVRGRQLDGPNELRFDSGLVPPRERRLRGSGGHPSHPSFTRLRAPGCYAYQVDGLRFSYRIVFEAKLFA